MIIIIMFEAGTVFVTFVDSTTCCYCLKKLNNKSIELKGKYKGKVHNH